MLPVRDQIDLELRKIVDPKEYDEWLTSPNVELGMRTPAEVLNAKDYQALWGMISRGRM